VIWGPLLRELLSFGPLLIQAKKKVEKKKKSPKSFNSVRMGQRIGNLFGRKAGRVGAEAGRLFRTLTGFGDYKVNSNTLLTGQDTLPMFRTTKTATHVRHREYVCDIITSATPGQFKLQRFAIQPGLPELFPWLAASAENYEQYEIEGMVAEFKSNSYDALGSTNTASGVVVMTTQYNALSAPFVNKIQMEQYEYTCSSKPSKDLLHPVECAREQTQIDLLNIRTAPAVGDLRLYDLGVFNIATVGMQGASTNVGELWITYDIKFLKPRLGNNVDVFDHYIPVPVSSSPLGTPFGNPLTTLKTPNSDMGTVITGTSITWPPSYTGNVMVVYAYNVEVFGIAESIAIGYAGTGGAAAKGLFHGSFWGNMGASAAGMRYTTTQGYLDVTTWSITGGGTVTFSGGTGSPLADSIDLLILALPTSVD
jgi:hypothetical protein